MKNDELKNAPRLQEMNGENPFTVPDGYFDSLSARIKDRINAPKPKTVWEKLFEPLQRPAFAYASITLVMLFCVGVYFYQKQTPLPVKQFAEANISTEDLYNAGMISDFDEYTLIEVLVAKANSQKATTEIEDYLIDANTDEYDLINAL